jgi:hypothetical protein
MARGWLIGVMVEVADEPGPVRHFFAVGVDDRAKAEWRAIDIAQLTGPVATSPIGGLEPVHLVAELSARTIGVMALKAGEVRPLGWRWPRRWLTPTSGRRDEDNRA